MGTDQLRGRGKWQDLSGSNAGIAESLFMRTFSAEFENTSFRVRPKPREFSNIYSSIVLSDEMKAQIYSPDETWKHGVIPDFAIDNIETKKTLYVEVKRQDGWVEEKPRSAGRGNAHERSCKFFTPGLLKVLREQGKLGDNVLPFWAVFQGDIARDPKRVREISCWYSGHEDHFFMWSDGTSSLAVLHHFNTRLRHLLL